MFQNMTSTKMPIVSWKIGHIVVARFGSTLAMLVGSENGVKFATARSKPRVPWFSITRALAPSGDALACWKFQTRLLRPVIQKFGRNEP